MEKLEITYSEQKVRLRKRLAYITGGIELALIAGYLVCIGFLTETPVTDVIYAVSLLGLMLMAPFAIVLAINYWRYKRWMFVCDGTVIIYRSFWKREKELRLREIEEIEITFDQKLRITDTYGKKFLSEKISRMPEAKQIISYLKDHDVVIHNHLERLDFYQHNNQERTYISSSCAQNAGRNIYEEETSSYINDQYNRKRKHYFYAQTGASILYMICFIMGFKTGKIYRFFFAMAVAIIVNVVFSRIINRLDYDMEQRIRREGISVAASVVDYKLSNTSNTPGIPVFEFRVGDKLHRCKGIVSDPFINKYNYRSLTNQSVQIYYAPEISDRVASGLGTMNHKQREKNTIGTVVACIGSAFLIAVGCFECYKSFTVNAYQDEGASIKITYDEEYTPSKYKQNHVYSKTEQWICATCGIYNAVNKLDSSKLGGTVEDSKKAESMTRMLKDGWGITDRKSAIKVLNKLLDHGHRKQFHKTVDEMRKKGWLDMDADSAKEIILKKSLSDTKKQHYLACLYAYESFGDRGMDAWDYCRMIQILGDCYESGYISLQECLDQALPVAQLIQSEYNSWEEMNQSYLYGFWLYSGTDINEYGSESYYRYKEYQDLKSSSDNPFKRIDFNMELKDTWSKTLSHK